jgi:hypothetical protein
MGGITSGFVREVYFPVGNNVFYVPIVLRYFQSTEGPHDPFHESLTGFVSWFWPILGIVATEQNIEALFVGGVILARALTILAIYFLITSASRRSWELALVVSLMSFIPWPQNLRVGGGEIFCAYLTHSQYAHALCIFSIALAVRQRWLTSVIICGVVANINIFLAFWTVVVIMGARTFLNHASDRRMYFRFLLVASTAFLLLASPTLYWIFSQTTHEYKQFSFKKFLHNYYPHHTYIHLRLREAVYYFLACLAVLILWYRNFRVYCVLKNLGSIFLIGLGVLLLGSFAAYMTNSRMILNLHPLRFASVIAVVGASLFVAMLEKAKEESEGGRSNLWGADLSPTGLVQLVGGTFSRSNRHTVDSRGIKILFVVVGVLMLYGLVLFSVRGFVPHRNALYNNGIAVQRWARLNTPPETLFYSHNYDGFSTLSRRPVWWSWKEGAAVMWAPWFHEQWDTRRELVWK